MTMTTPTFNIGDHIVPIKERVTPFRHALYTGVVIEVGDGWLGLRSVKGSHVRLRTCDVTVTQHADGSTSTLVYSTDAPTDLPDIVHAHTTIAPELRGNAKQRREARRRAERRAAGMVTPSSQANPVARHHGVATTGSR